MSTENLIPEPAIAVGDRDEIVMHMELTPETYRVLDSLSDDFGGGLGDVLSRAVALLSVAVQARREGKQIGITREGRVEALIDI